MAIAKQEFTDAGRSMLGRAQNGEVLTITKLVVGSGIKANASQLWPLTALVAQEMNVTISSKNDYGQGTLLVEGNFRSDTAPHAFDLNELGVMAHIGAEADRLYSVANTFGITPDHIDPAAPTVQVFKLKLVIDRIPAASLVIQIGPSESVSGQNIGADTVGPGWYKTAAGNVLNFKRIVQGAGMDIHDAPDGNSVYVGMNILGVDLDLYVPASHPDAPNPSVAFPTIQAALDSVANTIIPSSKFVTVHVYTIRVNEVTGVTLDHPNSSQIKIIGMDVVSRTVTGTITVAGTNPNFDVTVNVASTTGIALGDVVHLYDPPNAYLDSAGYVLATTATTVKIRMETLRTLVSVAALGTTKLLHWPTQIHTASVPFITLFNFLRGVRLLKNIAMRSTNQDKNDGAIVRGGDGTVENIAAVGNAQAVGVSGGILYLTPIVTVNSSYVGLTAAPFAGIISGNPTAWNRVVFGGCSNAGIRLDGGSFAAGSNGTRTIVCGSLTGISCPHGNMGSGSIGTSEGGLIIQGNTTGIHCYLGGAIRTVNDSVNQILQNDTDLFSTTGGQISIIHNSTSAVTANPALGVLGPSAGYNTLSSP